MEILTVENLTFKYPDAEKNAVDGVSLTVSEGDFFVLCGQSGCGKSTLLRQLKPVLAPHGRREGRILFDGAPLSSLSERDAASKIGFVMQSPENQIVTDKVWHELAFGPESLGWDTPTIRRRVAEMASFFGIQNWFYKNTSELSGGQKQLLNLASVMVMQPKILILDEPTAQLDPIAASDFLATLTKINRELGTTVILTEHRLEEALPSASKAAVMENGRLLCCGSTSELGLYLKQNRHPMFAAMPAAMQIWGSVTSDENCPVSVGEGRIFLNKYISQHGALAPIGQTENAKKHDKVMVSATEVWFKYEKELPDAVKGVSLTAYAGELLAVLGGNGTGKTTTLGLLAGLKTPYRGRIDLHGRVGLLPQDPQTLFVKNNVFDDLGDALASQKLSAGEKKERINNVISLCRLSGLEKRHPYDLSGGEQQRAALAKLLLTNPDILLLDEPTKGFDAQFKREFAAILKSLTAAGVCIIMVSHDVEFCAQYADRCALFFDGSIVSSSAPRLFFSENSFYTTSASRIARGQIPLAVTTDDVIDAIGGRHYSPENGEIFKYTPPSKEADDEKKTQKLPLWRRISASVCGILAAVGTVYALKNENLSDMLNKNGFTALGARQFCIYGAIVILMLFAALLSAKRSAPSADVQTPVDKRKLSKRTKAAVVMILLLIPFTLFVGAVYIDSKQYYITALLVLIECMLPFFMIFEGRKPKSRELVLIAVLCALGVASRAVFFMLPQFKPVLALTVIAGVALGGETGFLVGAVSMLVSNIFFSQGAWTPWQMFAMGIIGFLAGVLFRKGLLRRTKASLCTFGALSAIIIYGGIINPAAALIWGGQTLNLNIIVTYYLTGFPMDVIHAAATVVFLLFLAEPMLEKLDRIKSKYGLY